MSFPKTLFFLLYLTITTLSFGKKILFIGNSYTSQCSRSISDLFKNESPEWKLTFHTKGGKDLAYHLADPRTKPMVLSQKWDFVVLQEQSQKSGLGGKFSKDFRDAVNSFSTMIRKNGSTPCLYLTWGRKAGDKKNPTRAKNCTIFTKSGIRTAYGAKISPKAVPVIPNSARQNGTNKMEAPISMS